MSVTSRILIVDMLNKCVPTEMITGITVLHAERVTPTSTEAFIMRIFRQENQEGFVKAFSDNAEHFTVGVSPLQTVLSQLRIRNVDIWPRFHEEITKDLGRRRADVVELHQPPSASMRAIQTAIVECLDGTLAEVRRSHVDVDVEDLNVESALYRAFDVLVRRQLEPVWHRISPGTKQLVGDLSTLRSLLHYLLTYDPISFYAFLETIVAANSSSESGSRPRQSPWLLSDAADVIFREARGRLWKGDLRDARHATEAPVDEVEDAELSSPFIPRALQLVLEEPPKWRLLLEVLDEIEQTTYLGEREPESERLANDTILIMTDSDRTTFQLRALLANARDTSTDHPGRRVLFGALEDYFRWKFGLGKMQMVMRQTESPTPTPAPETRHGTAPSPAATDNGPMSEALRQKGLRRAGEPANKRRRVRGAMSSSPTKHGARVMRGPAGTVEEETAEVAEMMRGVDAEDAEPEFEVIGTAKVDTTEDFAEGSGAEEIREEFMDFFGLLDMDNTVVVRTYQGDDDESVLHEIRPRYVVMYDPNPRFIRQIEVYRAIEGAAVQVYFMMYTDSVEEQMYLGGLRREKDAFERLIRMKANMALPLTADGAPREEDANQRMLRTISTRVAGAQRVATAQPPTVVVDLREFRSSLPSFLHAAGLRIVPCTLQVGDYVISSEMCVERKSLSDLVQSLNSGRLYTQCEVMSVHYQHPILLIEFDQEKAFTLQTIGEATRGPSKPITARSVPSELDVQAKLVLLTLTFPRLRIIWSASPYATADIFVDLKQNYDEPDAAKVAAIGLDDHADNGAEAAGAPRTYFSGDALARSEQSFSLTPLDMLRAMPGVTSKNYLYLANRVRNLQELCHMPIAEIQALIGVEPGRRLHSFLHAK